MNKRGLQTEEQSKKRKAVNEDENATKKKKKNKKIWNVKSAREWSRRSNSKQRYQPQQP